MSATTVGLPHVLAEHAAAPCDVLAYAHRFEVRRVHAGGTCAAPRAHVIENQALRDGPDESFIGEAMCQDTATVPDALDGVEAIAVIVTTPLPHPALALHGDPRPEIGRKFGRAKVGGEARAALLVDHAERSFSRSAAMACRSRRSASCDLLVRRMSAKASMCSLTHLGR